MIDSIFQIANQCDIILIDPKIHLILKNAGRV